MPSRYSKFRNSAAQNQKHRCYYCNAPMWSKSPKSFIDRYGVSSRQADRFECTAEHLDARCDGGEDTAENIVAACKACNQSRHRRKEKLTPPNYSRLVTKRISQGKWHPNGLSSLSMS